MYLLLRIAIVTQFLIGVVLLYPEHVCSTIETEARQIVSCTDQGQEEGFRLD